MAITVCWKPPSTMSEPGTIATKVRKRVPRPSAKASALPLAQHVRWRRRSTSAAIGWSVASRVRPAARIVVVLATPTTRRPERAPLGQSFDTGGGHHHVGAFDRARGRAEIEPLLALVVDRHEGHIDLGIRQRIGQHAGVGRDQRTRPARRALLPGRGRDRRRCRAACPSACLITNSADIFGANSDAETQLAGRNRAL